MLIQMGQVVAANGGVFELVNSLTSDATTTIRNITILLAIVSVVITYFKTGGNIAKTVIAGLVGGLVIWLTTVGLQQLSNKVDNDLASTKPAVVQTLPNLPDSQLF